MSDDKAVAVNAEVMPSVIKSSGDIEKLKDFARHMEMRLAFLNQIMGFVYRDLDPSTDITRIGGKIRRNVSAKNKAVGKVGGSLLCVRDPSTGEPITRTPCKDAKGEYYIYTSTWRYETPWGTVCEGVGMASSRDPFLGQVNGDFRPIEEIDEASIAQFAITEAQKKAVFPALAWALDVTEEELKRFGVDPSKATTGHSFAAAKGNQGGSTDTTPEAKDKRSQIEAMCVAIFKAGTFTRADGLQPQCPDDVLKIATEQDYEKNGEKKHFGGWKDFKSISEKSLDITFKKIADLYKKECGEDLPF